MFNKLKYTNPTALPTVEDLAAIYGIMDVSDDVGAEKATVWVQWAENDSPEARNIAFIAYEEGELIEQNIVLPVFVHRCRKYRSQEEETW